MLIHHVLVFVAATLDLVREFGVLLGDADLSLQPLLLVVQFAQPVLQHLSLAISKEVTINLREGGSNYLPRSAAT